MNCYKQFKQMPVVPNIMALSQLEYKQITLKSKPIAVNPFLGMVANIKLPKGRGNVLT